MLLTKRILLASLVALGTVLAGCHIPDAEITTVQDSKNPAGRSSKVGFSSLPAENVNTRLALETAQEQMRRLGFNIVAPENADFLVHADQMAKDLVVADEPSGTSFGTAVGAGSGGVFTGVGVGFPLGSPSASTLHRTQLEISLETTQSPKIIVWQGKILAETADANQYRGEFYRALLGHVGESFNGTVRLDKVDKNTPNP